MVDAADSKSVVGDNVLVQVRPGAPLFRTRAQGALPQMHHPALMLREAGLSCPWSAKMPAYSAIRLLEACLLTAVLTVVTAAVFALVFASIGVGLPLLIHGGEFSFFLLLRVWLILLAPGLLFALLIAYQSIRPHWRTILASCENPKTSSRRAR
jgi:hypothetical protein